MIKKCVSLCVVALMMGAYSSHAVAGPTAYAYLSGWIYADGPSFEVTSADCTSYGYLRDLDTDEESASDPWETSVELETDYGNVNSFANSDDAELDASAYVEPEDGMWAQAIGASAMDLRFYVDTEEDSGGQLSFALEYESTLEAWTEALGERAHAEVGIEAILENLTTGETVPYTYVSTLWQSDGESWGDDFSDSCELSLFFNEGDSGRLYVGVAALAEAGPSIPAVPVPGAVLLGGFGVVLVGRLRRRAIL